HGRDARAGGGGTCRAAGEDPFGRGKRAAGRGDDDRHLVGDRLDAPEVYSQPAQLARKPRTILVRHLGGEDLVADHDDGCCAHSSIPGLVCPGSVWSRPYSRIFLINVVRDTPRRAASRDLFPCVSRSPRATSSFSSWQTAVA